MPNNQNYLDQKLNAINTLFDQIEDARVHENVDLQLQLMATQRQNIQDLKQQMQQMQQLLNESDKEVMLVLEQMNIYSRNQLDCAKIVPYMTQYNWLNQFTIYYGWWLECSGN